MKNLKERKIEKKEKKENIEKLDLEFDYELDAYKIAGLRHSDSRIDMIAEKLNEIIDKLNDIAD